MVAIMRYSIRHSSDDNWRHCELLKPQQGVALITAVLVAAMVTATAVTMATTHRFSMQRGFNQLNGTWSELGVKALEADISRALVEDTSFSTVDSLDEAWATAQWAADYVNTSSSATLTDLQSFFNLQNLATQFGAQAFRNKSSSARAATATATERENTTQSDLKETDADDTLFSTPAASILDADPSAEQLQDETFDWTEHKEFIDSYVESCGEENQACAREAIALAFEQSRASSDGASQDAQLSNIEDSFDPNSPINPGNSESQAATRQPNGPLGGASGEANSGAKDDNAIDSEAQLSALFRALDLDLEPVQAILDWIDQDSETRYPNGAEDEYYTGLESPYRAGNSPFATIRELLLVRGVTMEIYEKLAPHLSVLPQATPININTASADVLMAIHPMIDRSTAELIIDSRKVQPFQTVKAFIEHPALLGLSIPIDLLSTNSDYFQINTMISSQGLQTHHQARLKRSNLEVFVFRRARGYFN